MKITIKSNGKITSAQIQEIQRKNENIGIKAHEINGEIHAIRNNCDYRVVLDVISALKQFRAIATDNGVSESWIGRVESTIVEHLKAWGEWEYETADVAIDINGHTVSNMHVEQTYKGNYHLLANIDGTERKFVIGKNKEEFAFIEQIGLANLTIDHLKPMIEKYFNL